MTGATKHLTTAEIELTLRSAVLDVAVDLAMLRRSHLLFQSALADERYAAIARHEDDVRFWLRGMALRAGQEALAKRDVAAAGTYMDWASNGVPENIRKNFVDILLRA